MQGKRGNPLAHSTLQAPNPISRDMDTALTRRHRAAAAHLVVRSDPVGHLMMVNASLITVSRTCILD